MVKPGSERLIRLFAFSGLLLFVPAISTGCSKYVYEHDAGRLSRGSFLFMKNIYYQGQFEEEETLAKRNQAIVDDMATVEGIGALATKKGILEDPSYPEYLFRQQRSRHAKAAIWFWQQKYKEKFNWQMLLMRHLFPSTHPLSPNKSVIVFKYLRMALFLWIQETIMLLLQRENFHLNQ